MARTNFKSKASRLPASQRPPSPHRARPKPSLLQEDLLHLWRYLNLLHAAAYVSLTPTYTMTNLFYAFIEQHALLLDPSTPHRDGTPDQTNRTCCRTCCAEYPHPPLYTLIAVVIQL